MSNPLKGFTVNRDDIRFIGHDLQRPECILAERDGTLWSADARGGVVRIAPDGSQELIVQTGLAQVGGGSFEDRYVNTQGSLPNGLAFDAEGNFLIANFGTDRLEFMKRNGESHVMLDNIDGRPLGKANFVTRDSKGRLWLTVTTQTIPWTDHVKTRRARESSPTIFAARTSFVSTRRKSGSMWQRRRHAISPAFASPTVVN